MLLNTSNKIINIFIPKIKIDKNKILALSENKVFYNKKNKHINFLPYQNTLIKNTLKQFKFNKKQHFSKIFAQILNDNLPDILFNLKIQENFTNPIIIIIPTSLPRKIKRRYDHNHEIIKNFIKENPSFIKYEKNILNKKWFTKAQSHTKNKKERKKNIQNSFKMKKAHKVKAKNILLFDDIKTTGYTLDEAKRILKKAGAKQIITITLAH